MIPGDIFKVLDFVLVDGYPQILAKLVSWPFRLPIEPYRHPRENTRAECLAHVIQRYRGKLNLPKQRISPMSIVLDVPWMENRPQRTTEHRGML